MVILRWDARNRLISFEIGRNELPTIRPVCRNNPKCPSISARDPEIGVPKPDTEYAYTGKP